MTFSSCKHSSVNTDECNDDKIVGNKFRRNEKKIIYFVLCGLKKQNNMSASPTKKAKFRRLKLYIMIAWKCKATAWGPQFEAIFHGDCHVK